MILFSIFYFSIALLVTEELNYPTHSDSYLCSCTQLKETMEWLSSYFFRLRVSNTNTATFGLYPHWHLYIEPIVAFLLYLVHHATTATVHEVQASVVTGDDATAMLWSSVTELFAPWIQPLDNNGQILAPWIEGDTELATTVITSWAEGVDLLQSSLVGEGSRLFLSPSKFQILISAFMTKTV